MPYVASEQEAIEILGKPSSNTPIESLDCLIFGPGGYFGEPPVNYLRKLYWAQRNYKRHIIWNNKLYKAKIPYVIIGVGVGPLTIKPFRNKVVKLFENAMYISVRDKYSKEYLIKWGIDASRINVVSDVALTLQPDSHRTKNKKTKVALHFPGKELYEENKMSEFIEFVKQVLPENDFFLLEDSKGQFSNVEGDNIRKALLENNIDLPIVKYKDPKTLINDIQSFDKIITSKLHVGIVGYALGKKILSIPRHSKTIRFYEQINQESFCIQFSNINRNLLFKKFQDLDSIDNSNNVRYKDAIKNKDVLKAFLDEVYANSNV